MELLSKRFQDGIRRIPECDWLDRAYEMGKKLDDDSPFNAAKCVGLFPVFLSHDRIFSSLSVSFPEFFPTIVYVCVDGRIYQPI